LVVEFYEEKGFLLAIINLMGCKISPNIKLQTWSNFSSIQFHPDSETCLKICAQENVSFGRVTMGEFGHEYMEWGEGIGEGWLSWRMCNLF